MTSMTTTNKAVADMIATYFFGVPKTQVELRDAIRSLGKMFPTMTEADVEIVARHNEATQGVKLF